jgi:superfamily I DNA/RNA helicase
MRWMVTPNQLDATQSDAIDRIVDEAESTHWISGYAGTGKTIVLTHAINRVAQRYPGESVGFVTYTHALKDLVATGIERDLSARVNILTIKAFYSKPQDFDHLFVDEVQDAESKEIARLREHTAHLVVAGDPDQSIYQGRVNPADLRALMGPCTEHRLDTVYRLSKNTRQIASAIYPAGGIKAAKKFRGANDLQAEFFRASSPTQEAVEVFDQAYAVCEVGLPSAILLPGHDSIYEFACQVARDQGTTQPPKPAKTSDLYGRAGSRDYEDFNEFFADNEIPLMYIGNDYGSLSLSDEQAMVYLMTYHSSKGLDFPQVFLPRLTIAAQVGFNFDDEANKRRIMFVAVTRSRSKMTFSRFGLSHRFLEEIEGFLAPATF